jgi:hypothetical protein
MLASPVAFLQVERGYERDAAPQRHMPCHSSGGTSLQSLPRARQRYTYNRGMLQLWLPHGERQPMASSQVASSQVERG